MTDTQYDIVGLGNPVVDILAHVDEEFIERHKLIKGTTHLVDESAIWRLCTELREGRTCSGGSAANTIVAMAELGAKTAFLGRIARDEMGDTFVRDIQAAKVTFPAEPAEGGKPTACCAVCVTPDGERTMCVYIGASSEFAVADVDADIIAASKIMYIEGYLWDAPQAKEAISHAISIAEQHDARIAFTLSDLFCVDRHRDDFLRLIEDHVDILFCNEDESRSLYHSNEAEEVAEKLKSQVDYLVITRSEQPAIVGNQGNLIRIPPRPVPQIEDVTGAGDMFAAGFLHGLLEEAPIDACTMRGHMLAGHIIRQLGARSDQPLRNILGKAA